MIILSGKDIMKSYGTDVIIKDINFTIQENEKIGIVGVNGAGKTTLFKIIAGVLEKDSGNIYIGKNLKLGYMSQDFDLTSGNSIWQEMLTVFENLIALENNLQQLEQKISNASSTNDTSILEALLKTYSKTQEEFHNSDGFSYQSQIKGVLKGLGFDATDYDKKISTLSGGQKTRIALGKTLLMNYDVLMLDEPTNYLDIESVEWLEEFLKNTRNVVLVISHDRYFLDTVTNKTFEIENNTLTEYNGNYSKYVELKQVKIEQQQKEYEQQQKEVERQQAIIDRFKQYNREKSIKQAESREKALEKMELTDKPLSSPKSAHFRFEPKVRSGNDVLYVEDLSKSYDKKLFESINFKINRGDKVALIGPNGIGKTTILKILTERVKADSGFIKPGANVVIGYYEQEQESLNKGKLVIDEIWDEYPQLNQTDLRNMLAAFLFSGEDVFKQISTLSGGEKSRLALLKLMLSKSNFLLLDEPTNHLDITSKEVLENALSNYSGTVLFISHDRYFINKIATKVFELTTKKCNEFLGNYSYYQYKKAELAALNVTDNTKTVQQPVTELKNDWLKQKEDRSSLKKQQKRLETVEKTIESNENRIKEIDELQATPEIFSDHIKCQELHNEQAALKSELDALYIEWEELTEILSDITQQ